MNHVYAPYRGPCSSSLLSYVAWPPPAGNAVKQNPSTVSSPFAPQNHRPGATRKLVCGCPSPRIFVHRGHSPPPRTPFSPFSPPQTPLLPYQHLPPMTLKTPSNAPQKPFPHRPTPCPPSTYTHFVQRGHFRPRAPLFPPLTTTPPPFSAPLSPLLMLPPHPCAPRAQPPKPSPAAQPHARQPLAHTLSAADTFCNT